MTEFDTNMAIADAALAEEFGKAATFTPTGGDAEPVTAMKGDESAVTEEGQTSLNRAVTCEITILSTFAAGRPADKSTLVIGDETWIVREVLAYSPGYYAKVRCVQQSRKRTGGVSRRPMGSR